MITEYLVEAVNNFSKSTTMKTIDNDSNNESVIYKYKVGDTVIILTSNAIDESILDLSYQMVLYNCENTLAFNYIAELVTLETGEEIYLFKDLSQEKYEDREVAMRLLELMGVKKECDIILTEEEGETELKMREETYTEDYLKKIDSMLTTRGSSLEVTYKSKKDESCVIVLNSDEGKITFNFKKLKLNWYTLEIRDSGTNVNIKKLVVSRDPAAAEENYYQFVGVSNMYRYIGSNEDVLTSILINLSIIIKSTL